ncbi:dihydropteroate synthase [Crocinitomix sp.]|nr:dihydropteroate synthase [Crocinitomix sp.]
MRFNCKGILMEFPKPIVMGILNTTPDSFYAKSRATNLEKSLQAGNKMIEEGATIIDVGGYSSRPGADDISIREEMDRVLPVISFLKLSHPKTLISIDTFRSEVAEAAIEKGADIINDISGGQIDERILSVAAKYDTPYILMHMRGTPQDMMQKTTYSNLLEEVAYYFSERIQLARTAGIKDIILDPGFGFSKTLDQNYDLMGKLDLLNTLDCPLLVGVSRKSMIYKKLNIDMNDSLNGTTALNTIALMKGAQILRVHDVKEAVEAVTLYGALGG